MRQTISSRSIKRQAGSSHRVLEREGWPDYVFAFHDDEEIGPRMLAKIVKRTGLQPEDLEAVTYSPAAGLLVSPLLPGCL